MKTKLRFALITMVTLLLAILGYSGYKAETGTFDGLLAAIPQTGRSSATVEGLDETHNDNAFLLTYESVSELMAEVNGINHTVRLKSVNYAYPFVMRFPVLSGGFFTEEAQKSALGHIVLNETAAFELFGGIDAVGCPLYLRNIPCMVIGVIDDGDTDNRNLYASAMFMDDAKTNPEGIVAVMNDSSTEAAVVNALKEVGVTEQNHNLFNLSALANTVVYKAYLGVCIVWLAVWWMVLLRLGIAARRYYQSWRTAESSAMKPLDGYGMNTANGKPGQGALMKGVCLSGLCAGTATLMAVTMRVMLPWLMHWREYPTPDVWVSPVFQDKISMLNGLGTVSDGCFAGLCLMTAMLLLAWGKGE